MFAVKRGEIRKRADVFFSLPIHKEILAEIKTSKYGSIELSEILIQLTDGTHYTPQYTEKGVPFISVVNVKENHVDFSGTKFVSAEEHQTLTSRCKPEPTDILLTKVGSIGRAVVIPPDAPEFSLFVSVALLKANKELVSPRYLCAYLNTRYAYAQFQRHLKGIGVPDLHLENIASTLIVYPKDLSTQERLCEQYYRAYNNHIAKRCEADELLAGIDKLLLEQLGIAEIPVKPRIASAVTLGTVKIEKTIGAEYYHSERLTVIRAIENNPAVSTRKLADIVVFLRETISAGGEPYLGLAGVVSNTGELSGAKEEAEGQAFSYCAGDVLYARLRPYLNKVLFTETNGVCSTEFHVMRVNCSDVLPEYLTAIMRSKIIVAQTKHMMTGNTHPRIANDDVRNLRIPVPSMDVQHTIINEMRKRVERSRLLKREAEIEWTAAKERFERELMGN